jgi:hypothetical protein
MFCGPKVMIAHKVSLSGTPAKAGVQNILKNWIPASTGMTNFMEFGFSMDPSKVKENRKRERDI